MTKTEMTDEWTTNTSNGEVLGEELFHGTGATPNDGLLAAIDRRVDTTSREVNAHEVVTGTIPISAIEHVLYTNGNVYNKVVLGIKLFVDPADVELPVSVASTNLRLVSAAIGGDVIISPAIQVNDLKWATVESPNFDTGTPDAERLCLEIPVHVVLEATEAIKLTTVTGVDIFESVNVDFELYMIG